MGKQLVTGNDHGQVKLWDVTTGKLQHEVPPGDDNREQIVMGIAFAPNGKRLAVGHYSGTVRVLDVSSNPPRMTPMKRDHFNVFGGATVSFSPDGKFLASAENGRPCAIRIWNLEEDKAPVVIEKPHQYEVVSTEFIGGGKKLISGGVRQKRLKISGREYIDFDCELRIWDPRTGEMLGELQDPNQETGASLAFSADEKILASAARTGIVIWDMPSRRPVKRIIRSFNSHDLDNAVDISLDGRILVASLRRETAVYMWDVATGERLHANLESHQSRVSIVAFDSDAKHVASVSDGIVRWWSLEGEKLVSTGIPDRRLDRGSHFSSDRTIVATLSKRLETGVLEVWDVRAGRKVMESTFSGEPGLGAISDDNQFVAIATRGQSSDPFGEPPSKATQATTFLIWRLDTGTRITQIELPDLPVVAVWFSDGGHSLSFLDRGSGEGSTIKSCLSRLHRPRVGGTAIDRLTHTAKKPNRTPPTGVDPVSISA